MRLVETACMVSPVLGSSLASKRRRCGSRSVVRPSWKKARSCPDRALVKCEAGFIKTALLDFPGTRKRFVFSQSMHVRKARLMSHASFRGVSGEIASVSLHARQHLHTTVICRDFEVHTSWLNPVASRENSLGTTQEDNMNRPLISAMATIVLVAVGQSATAQTPLSVKTKQMTISFRDLNVHSAVGAGVLLNRMRTAARIVCGPEPMFLDLGGRHFYDACRKNALDSAVAAVGAPEVVEIYGGSAVETRTASF